MRPDVASSECSTNLTCMSNRNYEGCGPPIAASAWTWEAGSRDVPPGERERPTPAERCQNKTDEDGVTYGANDVKGGCDYPVDVLYKAFNAKLPTYHPFANAFLRSFSLTSLYAFTADL